MPAILPRPLLCRLLLAGATALSAVAARAADIYGRVAHEMAAQDAVLDHLKGQSDG